ncbi:MAG: hypothetical protein IKQ07_04610 [Bacteroidaceae bacterium]|nr:hypothetical protein [Bacteroidaceae bacterium]
MGDKVDSDANKAFRKVTYGVVYHIKIGQDNFHGAPLFLSERKLIGEAACELIHHLLTVLCTIEEGRHDA